MHGHIGVIGHLGALGAPGIPKEDGAEFYDVVMDRLNLQPEMIGIDWSGIINACKSLAQGVILTSDEMMLGI